MKMTEEPSPPPRPARRRSISLASAAGRRHRRRRWSLGDRRTACPKYVYAGVSWGSVRRVLLRITWYWGQDWRLVGKGSVYLNARLHNPYFSSDRMVGWSQTLAIYFVPRLPYPSDASPASHPIPSQRRKTLLLLLLLLLPLHPRIALFAGAFFTRSANPPNPKLKLEKKKNDGFGNLTGRRD